MDKNIFWTSLKYIGWELMGDFLYFPIWWYTTGLKNTFLYIKKRIARKEKELALRIWIQNFFKPMYGQSDWQGKLISIIFRTILGFWKLFFFVIWILLYVFFFFVWLFLPIVILYQIIYFFI